MGMVDQDTQEMTLHITMTTTHTKILVNPAPTTHSATGLCLNYGNQLRLPNLSQKWGLLQFQRKVVKVLRVWQPSQFNDNLWTCHLSNFYALRLASLIEQSKPLAYDWLKGNFSKKGISRAISTFFKDFENKERVWIDKFRYHSTQNMWQQRFGQVC